jgi:sulfur relay (sulfurtransferase) DsrC/TusE family protein
MGPGLEPGCDLLWQCFLRGARRDGPWPLSDVQWRIARAVLEYYREQGKAPALVRVGRATGLGSREMFAEFPFGPIQTVFDLAGLPFPTGYCRGG